MIRESFLESWFGVRLSNLSPEEDSTLPRRLSTIDSFSLFKSEKERKKVLFTSNRERSRTIYREHRGTSFVVDVDVVGGGLNMTFWDKMIGFWWERRCDLSLFHSLRWLILIFVWVVIRIFPVQLIRVALTFNAVVVWVLWTGGWAIEVKELYAQYIW